MTSVPNLSLHSTPSCFRRIILGEVFLGFLAIVAAALTLIPLLFDVPEKALSRLEAGQWLIVMLFATEYGVGLASAPVKRKFLLNPWRIVDVATIVIPLITFLPGASQLFRSSPVLRLARLARIVTLGVRASGVVLREEKVGGAPEQQAPVQVRMLPAVGAKAPRQATWDEFVRWAKQPGAEWYSVANIGQHNLAELAQVTGISQEFIASHLLGSSYPQLGITGGFVSLFVWLPEMGIGETTKRTGLLLLASDTSIITFSSHPAHLLEKVAGTASNELSALPFPARMICQFLKLVLKSNEALVGNFEQQLHALEELPVRESRPQFFEQTFRLKKELSAAQSDLWRLRGVLKELAESRVKLPGNDEGAIAFLHNLAETADYLYETVSNIREELLSVIDLHLNVVSFEMNRVMRVLAVVSVLGLIPAVIGGLFGMNLAGNPWPITLSQVTFAVCMAMVTCLYFFVVKGWLR
ncbi:MAG TPA: CorA family divalent cation transporter [Clostridia bacterium]|nr:CorA family divalent cation transporter [Clostridia bacterium]